VAKTKACGIKTHSGRFIPKKSYNGFRSCKRCILEKEKERVLIVLGRLWQAILVVRIQTQWLAHGIKTGAGCFFSANNINSI
jgi:hypothetical protein